MAKRKMTVAEETLVNQTKSQIVKLLTESGLCFKDMSLALYRAKSELEEKAFVDRDLES